MPRRAPPLPSSSSRRPTPTTRRPGFGTSGPIEDEPDITDKRSPGIPTRSYRTTEPLRVIEEITGWAPPPPQLIERMRAGMAELAEPGIEAIDH